MRAIFASILIVIATTSAAFADVEGRWICRENGWQFQMTFERQSDGSVVGIAYFNPSIPDQSLMQVNDADGLVQFVRDFGEGNYVYSGTLVGDAMAGQVNGLYQFSCQRQ